MTKNKKLLYTFATLATVATLAAVPALAASCQKDSNSDPKPTPTPGTTTPTPTPAADWDSKITIDLKSFNSGFDKPNEQLGNKVPKQVFIDALTQKFNELKNADPELKVNPDVTFDVVKGVKPNKGGFTKLNSASPDDDILIASVSKFADALSTDEKFDKFTTPYLGQTATLKFKWTPEDSVNYKDGSKTDPLYLAAQEANKIWFTDTGLEYPDWAGHENEARFAFDGSKYVAFYNNDSYTFGYRGALAIAGDKLTREAIEKAWFDKNFDAFMAFGLLYADSSSGGEFKMQVSLLARQFNKSYDEVFKYLTGTDATDGPALKTVKNVPYTDTNWTPVQENLGKAIDGKVYHIGFVWDGDFNWNPSTEGSRVYKPAGFDLPGDSKAVVRFLTLTDTSVYDAVFHRQGLNKKEAQLVMKALSLLTRDENQLGIYTGFNKFVPGTKDNLLKTMIKVYFASTNPKANWSDINIPQIK